MGGSGGAERQHCAGIECRFPDNKEGDKCAFVLNGTYKLDSIFEQPSLNYRVPINIKHL